MINFENIIMIATALIIFGVLILVHEAGHFFVAKAVGIKVDKFAIGMGPRIFSVTKGETEYSIRAFPIGGYVKMEGEDEESDHARSFTSKSIPQKIAVSAAGAAMNFVLAILIIVGIFLSIGFPTTSVGELLENRPAQSAGIMVGDEILMVNETEITVWTDIQEAIASSEGESIEILINRDGSEQMIVTQVASEDGRRVIGIIPQNEKKVFLSFKYGVETAFALVGTMIGFFGDLFRGQANTGDVVGPVGIISLVGEATRQGVYNVMSLAAMISMNLAVINLLPLPALDGGRILLLAIQGITGKKISADKEGWIHFIGFAVLIGLLIVVSYRDIIRIFVGN